MVFCSNGDVVGDPILVSNKSTNQIVEKTINVVVDKLNNQVVDKLNDPVVKKITNDNNKNTNNTFVDEIINVVNKKKSDLANEELNNVIINKTTGTIDSSIEQIKSSHSDSQKNNQKNEKCESLIKYGELVVLGYNGYIPPANVGRRRSKYAFYKKPIANGVKQSKLHSVEKPRDSTAVSNTLKHSISYTLSRNQAVVVEYDTDTATDMFQIGRAQEPQIDCHVKATQPGGIGGSSTDVDSTRISRYACRIIIDRDDKNTARIYAAGFDSSRNIFLGEKATKWQDNDKIDGLTTNGLYIMQPIGDYNGGNGKNGIWREISVDGNVYALRPTRSDHHKGTHIIGENNILKDGTLIDLCEVTLLWRSAEGLSKTPTKNDLEKFVGDINSGRPQCPVNLNTLVIPRKTNSSSSSQQHQPYVYLQCGHVQGNHDWGQENSTTRKCPMCHGTGPVVKLCMGNEPAFYVDEGPPNYAFNPCGHMANEKTVLYWSQIGIPHGTNGYISLCPFCAIPLDGYPGYVKLIFQDNID
ncbi:hypothetical protein HCN44_001144 [Aphidius gifuensis]|uniref:Protein pellino n=1 Tax=Aphidius gifuensis TaxID=684658 RepID=A0A834XKW6_APHGI|nr:protein pellino-like [Aphidius gifuensis]KAF7988571.1 hypothetical protein HCN44_001144 [Aphidius gifuensis]